MSHTSAGEDVGLSQHDEPQAMTETWESIFASLARLETGLQTVEANLGQVHEEMESFRNTLDGEAA